MPSSRRRLLGAAPLLALAACAAPPRAGAGPAALLPPFDLPDGAPLRALGGLALDRAAIGFGGLSGLHLGAGLELAAVNDHGRWLTARLVLEGGRLAGLAGTRTGALRGGSGAPLVRGHQGDAEALARLPDGTWLVAYERWHRIRAHRTLDAPATYVPAPPGLETAPNNGGLESLAVLADGRLLAIAEDLAGPEPDTCAAWIGRAGAPWAGRGPSPWRALGYRPAPGHRPTDACGLPDGGALVVERRFSLLGGPFSGRLVRLTAADLAAPILAPRELARLEPPLPVDNWEGVGVVRHEGRLLVAVLSDDNENAFQRGLLLLFELVGA